MPRKPRFSRHSSALRPSRTPNGPGAGVVFRDIELVRSTFRFEVTFAKGRRGEVVVRLPIESMTLESAYDGVDCPHGFDDYASGGDKDAIAGTLYCSFDILPILNEYLNASDIEAMDNALDRGWSIVVQGDASFTDFGKPVYGAGYSRSRLSAGDGPEVHPNVELGLDVFAQPKRGQMRELCRTTIYEALDCQIEASEETAILYGTLDEPIYMVITDNEGGSGMFIGYDAKADAEAEFEMKTKDGYNTEVSLVQVDRDLYPYETLKEWNADDARTPNPRHYGPRRPRR
jgi:hypothetical protein